MQDGRADAALDPRPLELNSPSTAQADSAGTKERVTSAVKLQEAVEGAQEVQNGGDKANDGRSDVVEQPGETRQTAQHAQQETGTAARDVKEDARSDRTGAQAGTDAVPEPAVAAGESASTTSGPVNGAPTSVTQSNSSAGATGAAASAASDEPSAPTAPAEVVLAAPKPSNPAAMKSSLLLQADGHPSPTGSAAGSVASGTPPPTAGRVSVAEENGAARASPAPSASSAAGSTIADKPVSATSVHPPIVKKFSSSLSVNKKFLEKAGEKAKPEIKPVTARLATPPAPAPASSGHPRLFAGKLSSAGTLSLSTTPSVSTPTGWKKPTSPAPPATNAGQATSAARPGPSVPTGLPSRTGPAVWGSAARAAAAAQAGLGRMTNDFPTAAEAAHAKEMRAKLLLEQMQARERAEQARAAAAAAKNAHLLEELDAFRGKHLDPNAHHWDEDDDDFLDTTIEFADGTQYKIEQQAQADSAAPSVVDEELREPGPGELALREKPLAPGETVEQPKREERFGDDFDRSWPRRPSASGDGRNLFNERIGRLEPAASGKRPTAPEPSSILRPRERRPSDVPPRLETKHRRPSVTSPKASHAPLHPGPSAPARRPSVTEPKPNAWGRRPSVGTSVGERQLPPHMSAPGGRQLPPHMQASQPQSSASSMGKARGPLSPPLQRQSLPATATLRSPPAQAPPALAPAPAKAEGTAAEVAASATTTAPDSAAAEPVPNLQEMHAREMHAAAERAKKRREEEEQKRLEQIERAKRKAAELEEKMKAADVAKAEAQRQEREAKASSDAAAKTAVKAVPAGQPAAASAADKVASWRTGPRPGIGGQKQPVATGTAPPSRILARETPQPMSPEQAPAKPTAILARPNASNPSTSTAGPNLSASTTASPTQPAAWRRSEQPQPRTARQAPPHLANAGSAAAKAAGPNAQSVANPTTASSTDAVARPATPPSIIKGNISSPPVSPMHKRGDSQGVTGKSGYKLPAVSQLDDLMSRIKGAMVPSGDDEVTTEGVAAGSADTPRVKLPTVLAGNSATVKLPTRQPNLQTAPTTRGRGRGRGRPDVAQRSRTAAPIFEDREPQLPFHSSRTARPHSPPPAWKQYVVRLAPEPPRRRPQARQIRNFETLKYPQPLYPFSWTPVLRDANPRRLSRDDMLLPKRYTANGVPIFPVRLAPRTVVRNTAKGEKIERPTPTVSIARRALVRSHEAPQPVTPVEEVKRDGPDSAQTGTKPIHAVFGAPALTTAFAPDDSTRSSPWRLPAPVNGTVEASESTNSVSRTSGTPTFGMTGDLNGEKIEATPRRETSAPGLDAAALRMNPKSPPFQPADLASLAAAPASAAWPNKSLALSVLDPTAPSVWSTAPAESTVRIRTMSAVQPENSLQGLMDDDPSEVLPSSLAELKSDDGQSTEAQEVAVHEARLKDEARMRTMGPAAFSTFLHESAAAIDSSALAAQRMPYYGDSALFPNGLDGHSSTSPMPSYGTSHAYPAMYASSRAFGQPVYPGYPVGAPTGSPYAANGYPAVYSAHPYPSGPSPVPQVHGYAIRDASQSGLPLGITNPALMATYGYGQPAPRYGAVGASGPATIGRPTHNHSSPYARASMQQVPPTSFISPPYGSAYQPMAVPQQSYRPASPFGNGSHGSPPHSARLPGPSSTMASPVIVPQQLPPVPSFGMAVSPGPGYQQPASMTSPHARPAGLPPHSGMHGGGYGSYGARPNGAVPAGQGGHRGW